MQPFELTAPTAALVFCGVASTIDGQRFGLIIAEGANGSFRFFQTIEQIQELIKALGEVAANLNGQGALWQPDSQLQVVKDV